MPDPTPAMTVTIDRACVASHPLYAERTTRMEQRNLRTVVECSLRLCAAAEAQGLAVLSQTDRYGGAVLEPERWEEILEHVTQAHVHARQVDAALTRGRKRG